MIACYINSVVTHFQQVTAIISECSDYVSEVLGCPGGEGGLEVRELPHPRPHCLIGGAHQSVRRGTDVDIPPLTCIQATTIEGHLITKDNLKSMWYLLKVYACWRKLKAWYPSHRGSPI